MNGVTVNYRLLPGREKVVDKSGWVSWFVDERIAAGPDAPPSGRDGSGADMRRDVRDDWKIARNRLSLVAIGTVPVGGAGMSETVKRLLRMSQAELDSLFTASDAGAIPDGQADGTAIIAPGTQFSPEIATMVSHFAWQGKVFDAEAGLLKNRILPFGINAIVARVYKDKSWLDGKECIVLDYSQTSLLAHWIRDEIREIEPKIYLGKVYWDKTRLIDFALEF